ncbi:MAG TPA: hypothetical protein VL588_08620, partial [Bdellovibrionota bacterium]|nr:hypothetical protein [Bdellovibrionota bacterium]
MAPATLPRTTLLILASLLASAPVWAARPSEGKVETETKEDETDYLPDSMQNTGKDDIPDGVIEAGKAPKPVAPAVAAPPPDAEAIKIPTEEELIRSGKLLETPAPAPLPDTSKAPAVATPAPAPAPTPETGPSAQWGLEVAPTAPPGATDSSGGVTL